MDFTLSEEQHMLRKSVREFAETEIAPHSRRLDEHKEFPHEIFKKMGGMGYLGVTIPETYDGAGLGFVDYAVIIEEIARVDPAVGLSVAAHNGLCTSHLYRFGSDALKSKYLRKLARGEYIGAWSLTEPTAGSDAGGTRSRAVRDGDTWVLNGSKTFATHGSVGQVCVVFCVTDADKGKKGISAFLLEKGMDGFRHGKIEDKMGMRASDTAEVVMEDCRVPSSHLLGEEGMGFVNALEILDRGRVAIAALSLGTAQGAYEVALKYAKERRQFGKPIAAFQAISFMLADMAMRIEASRLLTYRAAWVVEAGAGRVTRQAAMAKLYASETAVWVAEHAVQVLGGYGYVKDFPAEKFYRDAKLCTIGEGTSEIQRLVIARQILGLA
ncbi:MAG TPA: acyl-CoA dehydrogenase family protein [Candidatus Polarisedimenticolia bacterium]|nr:acyl-CoA dehydrogenase family protein [Candidatus Polarisedimenticolia bacterium]